uniref:GAT domain-containing protein n=1 Tax=Calcidiscus leptoporus TaxID=127549 RepID=A0A7S0NRA8_9EUKA
MESGSKGDSDIISMPIGSPTHFAGPGLMPVNEEPLPPAIVAEAEQPSHTAEEPAGGLDEDTAIQVALAASLAEVTSEANVRVSEHASQAEHFANDLVDANFDVFAAVLAACTAEEACRSEVLRELLPALEQSQLRAQQLIEEGEWEETALVRLLQAHEKLSSTIGIYHAVLSGDEPSPAAALARVMTVDSQDVSAEKDATLPKDAALSTLDPFPSCLASHQPGSAKLSEGNAVVAPRMQTANNLISLLDEASPALGQSPLLACAEQPSANDGEVCSSSCSMPPPSHAPPRPAQSVSPRPFPSPSTQVPAMHMMQPNAGTAAAGSFASAMPVSPPAMPPPPTMPPPTMTLPPAQPTHPPLLQMQLPPMPPPTVPPPRMPPPPTMPPPTMPPPNMPPPTVA